MTDLLDRVEKYLWAEEDSAHPQEEPNSNQKRRDRTDSRNPDSESKRTRVTMPRPFTPLTASREHILNQVTLTQGPTKQPRASTLLEFNDSNLEGVICPFDDALIITLQVDAYNVKRILVDTGSSANIIFEEAFSQMGIFKERVKPISSPLYGFTGASAPVEGIIPFTVIVGTAPLQCVQTIDFLVVKVKSSYNGILGRTVSAILIQEQDSKKFPIYYVSKVLQGAELRYPITEKLSFSLLIAARKLRPYFQSHTITMLTDKPLRWILHKPDVSECLVPWSIELGKFDIQYKPRPSIKGDLVLRRMDVSVPRDAIGKLSPNWEGPYRLLDESCFPHEQSSSLRPVPSQQQSISPPQAALGLVPE
ncbi:hypothetical protein RJ639_047142 [Escallonia herrerae]|uniref:Reverse transcriptase RNase H-like domain-containing protein n=1 Tax=Escallonia herrerae TaxID=1293975 RepID=A0AA88W666_9ASTE|nr:hypothetical protein RJ639_047142 [Escallonia herrerae]